MRLKDKIAIIIGAGQAPGASDAIGNGRATALLAPGAWPAPIMIAILSLRLAPSGISPVSNGRGRARVTPLPPHRSRRALLTHRAPVEGRTRSAFGARAAHTSPIRGRAAAVTCRFEGRKFVSMLQCKSPLLAKLGSRGISDRLPLLPQQPTFALEWRLYAVFGPFISQQKTC